MNHIRIYAFVAGLWALIIIGGGVVTLVLGTIHLEEDADTPTKIALSAVKGIVAILLIIVWIYILNIVKRKIFASQKHA